jgi:hypothetical protein
VNEIFPNVIKSSAAGVVEAFHNTGSMMVPYLISWSIDNHIRPTVICAMVLMGGSMGICLIK